MEGDQTELPGRLGNAVRYAGLPGAMLTGQVCCRWASIDMGMKKIW